MKYYLRCPYCSGVAFMFKHKPYDKIKLDDKSVEGSVKGEIIKCEECKHIIYNKDLKEKNLGEMNESNN